jgi:ribosomal protein L16 Arg81 hydroxylase
VPVYQSLDWGMPSRMLVNGVSVKDALVLALAGAVKSPALAHKLQTAHRFRSSVINLSDAERRLVLAALDDRSPELQELREQLREHPAWRSATRIS